MEVPQRETPPTMKYPLCAALLCLLAPSLRAVDKVPEYKITDTYVTSPTMLVRMGDDGEMKEIWSGLDAGRMRHVPLFLETSVHAEIRAPGGWQDLRALKYHQEGTHPGYIHLVSDNGLVSIEVTSRRDKGPAPIFVTYTFSDAEDVRLTARFKYPEFTLGSHSDDSNGNVEFSSRWRGENAVLTTTTGPRLDLATEPAGTTLSADSGGFVKEIKSTRSIVLCVDATESPMAHPSPGSFVKDWLDALGGYA
jgi:hypothetical protein